MSDEPLITIGISARPAAVASTTSPRYAESAAMPMGAMPKGCAYSRPKSVRRVERFDTSTSARGTKPHSPNAARLSRHDALVSTAPET